MDREPCPPYWRHGRCSRHVCATQQSESVRASSASTPWRAGAAATNAPTPATRSRSDSSRNRMSPRKQELEAGDDTIIEQRIPNTHSDITKKLTRRDMPEQASNPRNSGTRGRRLQHDRQRSRGRYSPISSPTCDSSGGDILCSGSDAMLPSAVTRLVIFGK
jgi:hypothetical protein